MKLLFIASLISHFIFPLSSEGLTLSNHRVAESNPMADVVAVDSVFVTSPSTIMFEVEGYTDDIPFNTLDVVRSLGTTLPVESYVDDIPFDTEAIVQCRMSKRTKSKNSTI